MGGADRVEAAAQSVRPVVLVAHSLGTIAVAHAGAKLARLPAPPVGAFLVARPMSTTRGNGR